MSQKEWFEKDYYAILGVESTASQKEITKAYRALAKKFHPDANKGNSGAEAKFKELSNANDVIGNEETRKEYDSIRLMGQGGNPYGGNSSEGFGSGFHFDTSGGNDDISDLLSGLFSRTKRPTQKYPQQPGGSSYYGQGEQESNQSPYDVETELSLSFHQALEGSTVNVAYSVPNDRKQYEVKVKIPPCVNDKQRIKVTGKGKASPRGKNGDLYIVINVGTHPWFVRSGKNLSITIPITYAESIVGTNVKVPTLDKPVTVKVPQYTQTNKKLKVQGRGVQREGQTPGDLIITFEIIEQKDLSQAELDLFAKLLETQIDNPRSKFGLEK